MASGRGLYLIKLVGPKPSKCLWLGDRLDRAVPSTESPDTVLVHIYRRGARTVRGGEVQVSVVCCASCFGWAAPQAGTWRHQYHQSTCWPVPPFWAFCIGGRKGKFDIPHPCLEFQSKCYRWRTLYWRHLSLSFNCILKLQSVEDLFTLPIFIKWTAVRVT